MVKTTSTDSFRNRRHVRGAPASKQIPLSCPHRKALLPGTAGGDSALPRPLMPLCILRPPATSGSAHETARKEMPGTLKFTRRRRESECSEEEGQQGHPQNKRVWTAEGRGFTRKRAQGSHTPTRGAARPRSPQTAVAARGKSVVASSPFPRPCSSPGPGSSKTYSGTTIRLGSENDLFSAHRRFIWEDRQYTTISKEIIDLFQGKRSRPAEYLLHRHWVKKPPNSNR